MPYHVSEAVRGATTKCRHAFSCLEDGTCGGRAMCQEQDIDGTNVLFLAADAPTPAATCPYRIVFGGAQVCTCPTHYALALQGRRGRSGCSAPGAGT